MAGTRPAIHDFFLMFGHADVETALTRLSAIK
jgi:hypothetical protein